MELETYLNKKVVMAGDPGVGKTSTVRRFVQGTYTDGYVSTLGTVVKKKCEKVGNKNLTMMIWDISGQKSFKRIHNSGFKNSAGIIYVCDVTKHETIYDLNYWISATTPIDRESPAVPTVIVGNKYDLVRGSNSEEVLENYTKSEELLDHFAKKLKTRAFIVSAKDGTQVDNMFKYLGERMLDFKYDHPNDKFKDVPMERDQGYKLDILAVDVASGFNDEEFGMNILRKKAKEVGIEADKQPTDQQLIDLINRVGEAEKDFKEGKQVNANRIRRLGIINAPRDWA